MAATSVCDRTLLHTRGSCYSFCRSHVRFSSADPSAATAIARNAAAKRIASRCTNANANTDNGARKRAMSKFVSQSALQHAWIGRILAATIFGFVGLASPRICDRILWRLDRNRGPAISGDQWCGNRWHCVRDRVWCRRTADARRDHECVRVRFTNISDKPNLSDVPDVSTVPTVSDAADLSESNSGSATLRRLLQHKWYNNGERRVENFLFRFASAVRAILLFILAKSDMHQWIPFRLRQLFSTLVHDIGCCAL